MATPTPSREPVAVRAGDTWRWARAIPDYPAPGWTLTYTLHGPQGIASIEAAASGTSHLVTVAPEDSAGIAPGRYQWDASATDGTDRYSVGSGVITVLPDVAEATAYDGRSHARRMLAAIEAMMEGRATDGDLDVVKTSVGGRSTDFDLATLAKLRQQYAAAVAMEDDAAAIAAGGRSRRLIQTRFTG